jgi:hypothetical protein
MGLHDIMSAVRELTREEQALLIKHTVDIMQESGGAISPELESLLESRWQDHLANPGESKPARQAISEMMKKNLAGGL